MAQALDWSLTVLGPVEIVSDHSKVHGGHESSTCLLRTSWGKCYLKVHQSTGHWCNEVHAYEQWTGVFGEYAPKLLAVRGEAPFALIVTELPGRSAETVQLSPGQEHALWRAAGAVLAPLHELGPGACFGPCLRNGECAEVSPHDAREAVAERFMRAIERATSGGYITREELAILTATAGLIEAFEGEHPRPCHRDYCAANWLVGDAGIWTGVIDFEFAHWDVRVADFSRDPNWNWIHRPDLVKAFFEGYGRELSPQEEQQLLVAHAEYALGAILWGRDNAFYGFEQEGREALVHLAELMS